jgi:hypothetical protein
MYMYEFNEWNNMIVINNTTVNNIIENNKLIEKRVKSKS